ncbi:hypothetical protein HRbin13_00335 [bacterium HR13]|nr:hypothetical protein HRbin13_00335 [bacterium HR13]
MILRDCAENIHGSNTVRVESFGIEPHPQHIVPKAPKSHIAHTVYLLKLSLYHLIRVVGKGLIIHALRVQMYSQNGKRACVHLSYHRRVHTYRHAPVCPLDCVSHLLSSHIYVLVQGKNYSHTGESCIALGDYGIYTAYGGHLVLYVSGDICIHHIGVGSCIGSVYGNYGKVYIGKPVNRHLSVGIESQKHKREHEHDGGHRSVYKELVHGLYYYT